MLSKVSAAALALAATSVSAYVVSEPALSQFWIEQNNVGATNSETPNVKISIALPNHNMDTVEGLLKSSSTPGDEMYGQHLSPTLLRDLSHADPASVEPVLAWLAEKGIVAEHSFDRNTVTFEAPRATVEHAFQTRFRTVRNTLTGAVAKRAGDFQVPDELAGKIDAIFGLHDLPIPPRRAEKVRFGPAKVNPAVIEKVYNVGGVTVSRGTKNRQAVVEFQGQNAEQRDLTKFFKKQVARDAYQEGDEKIYKVVGYNGRNSGLEAALDIQYIMGVAPGIKTEFWGYPGQEFCKDMFDFTTDILGTDDAPNVFSVSYGWQGDLEEIGCEASRVKAVNENLAKIALRGISMLVSSGDSGSQFTGGKLYPSWPASSPYVTAVGATRFVNQDPSQPEMATDQFGSGGGFSYDFTRQNAHWQDAAINAYLGNVTNEPPARYFNANGRGTPDISAVGEGFQIYSGGFKQTIGGTSASAPTFAGLISLLNEARLAQGKGPLGLLNPLFYQHPEALKDVTRGTGNVDRNGGSFQYGWDAASGWDAVTGLGTPKFDELLKLALSV